jgi:AraC-like DNA-binding protein
MAGFESRQAFTDRFRAMYKKSPAKYREQGSF